MSWWSEGDTLDRTCIVASAILLVLIFAVLFYLVG